MKYTGMSKSNILKWSTINVHYKMQANLGLVKKVSDK